MPEPRFEYCARVPGLNSVCPSVRRKSASYAKPGEVAGYSAMILWRRTPRIGIVLLANLGQFDKLNRLGVKLIESAVQ